MAFGLETFASDGTTIVTTTTRLTRYMSSYSASLSPQASQFISVPGMANDGSWVVTGYTGTCSISISTDGFTVQNASTTVSYSFTLYVFRY